MYNVNVFISLSHHNECVYKYTFNHELNPLNRNDVQFMFPL